MHLCDWICQTAALNGECLYRDTCQQPVMNELGHQINCIFFWENTKPCQPVQPLRTLTSTKCSVDVDPSYKAFRQAPGLLQYILCVYIYIYQYYDNICGVYGLTGSSGRRGRPTLGSYLIITVWYPVPLQYNDITCFCFLEAPFPPRQWFDKDYRAGAQNDLTTLQGLVVAVKDCLRVKSGGLFMQAIRAMGFLV